MSNANRDYAIVYDVKNSSLVLSRPLNFYITDKNTSNIFIKLVTRVIVGNGIDQYTDIENASNYVLTMRVIKPNNEVKSLEATQHEPENIFQFDLTEDFKDIPGKYICELTISTIVSGRQELITSDPFNYEVKRSILSNVGEIIETEDTTVEKLLNNLDVTKAELSLQIKEKANITDLAVERARIDSFTSLQEGSTTGDAELIDGRVGADGVIYDNIGKSLREQIKRNDDISTFGYIQLNLKNVEQGTFTNGEFKNSNTRVRYKPFKVEKGDIIEFRECNLYYNMQIIENFNGGRTIVSLTGENGWYKSNQLYEITENGYLLLLFANGNSHSTSTDITPNDLSVDIIVHKFGYKEQLKNNRFQDNINNVLGLKNGDFVGVYKQSSPNGFLINTKKLVTEDGARLVYKINVKKGEKLTIINNNNWTKDNFSNECIACDVDNKILSGVLTNYSYTDIEGNKQVIRNYGGTYNTVKANTFITVEVLVDCIVYVGIRFDGYSPATWEILDNKYYSCFSVFVKNEGYKNETYKISPSWNPILSIHRGWADAPQNTTQAFYNAFKNGYKMCECDIRETSDGEIVISHDATIKGLLNGELVTYTVANETLETLKQLTLYNDNYTNCKIATLEEIVELAKYFNGMYFLDMKVFKSSVYYKCVDILKRYDYLHKVYFNPNRNVSLAQNLIDKDNNVNIGFAPKTVDEVINYDKFLNRNGRTFISIDINLIPNTFSVEDYQKISEKGYEIGLWNVDTASLNKCIDLHPSIIEFTDESKSSVNWWEQAKQYIVQNKLKSMNIEL